MHKNTNYRSRREREKLRGGGGEEIKRSRRNENHKRKKNPKIYIGTKYTKIYKLENTKICMYSVGKA